MGGNIIDIANAHDIGQLFRVAASRFRARHGKTPDVALPGASRALLRVGSACEDPSSRAYVLERALRAASSEQRTTWTMDVLTALSAVHEPARAVALTAAREELSRKTATDASSQVLVRASIECLATLVSLAPRDGRVALFRETEAACKSKSFPPYDLPWLLARAAPGMGEVAPAVLLEAIALSHEYYRALGYALVAAELPPAWRARAIASALENAADPSLGDARVFVAIAPHLSPEMHPRAVELASRLHPSPGFGATAMRALQGNAEDVARDAAGGRSDQGLLALPRAALYARFLTVFEQGFAEDGDEPFEDERGCGLVEWMQLVPLLGGDDAARDVADAVAP